jgi:prepilin-type N-terminal cleavage/methylation domain-containing protein
MTSKAEHRLRYRTGAGGPKPDRHRRGKTVSAPARGCISRLRAHCGGFTLLELVIAVTILATFVVPMLGLIAESRVRTMRTTIERQARGLAQSKLHERIHFFEIEDRGTFELQGFPAWTWEFLEPEMRTQGEQVVLIYTIRIAIPQQLEGVGTAGETGTTFDYTTWTFPDARWYEEEQLRYERGEPSLLYGLPEGVR